MSRILTSAAVRAPIALHPLIDKANLVQTHKPPALPAAVATSSSAPSAANPPSSLHDSLLAAWQALDWAMLAATAKAHLIASGPHPALHWITKAAIAFFDPASVSIANGDVGRFLHGFPSADLNAYLAGPADDDFERLADDALALHCLGMLGGAAFDYVGALRAIEAMRTCAKLPKQSWLHIPHALFRRLTGLDIGLPAWSFEIDPCRRAQEDGDWVEFNPLEQKIAKLEERTAAAAATAAPGLPKPCYCEPPKPVCTPPDPCCAKVNYFVADLLELRDWVHRYKAGDIAYIEVVAAGEKRSRKHRMKRTRELYSEIESTERSSEIRDLQVSSRFSLQKEIERQREESLSGEASATASYDAKPYKLTAAASISFERSSSEAIRHAQEEAVEAVRKAVSEIETHTRTLRSERNTAEEEEKNLHSFSNATATPMMTQYHYVTQERRAQLFSYGKRLLAEFIVPEPARVYEALMKRRREGRIYRKLGEPPKRGDLPDPPAPLEAQTAGMAPLKPLGFDADSMALENYAERCATWGVTPPPEPPAATSALSLTFEDQSNHKDGSGAGSQPFQVPTDYQAVSMSIAAPQAPEWGNANQDPHKVVFSTSQIEVWWAKEHGDKVSETFPTPLTGSHTVAATAWWTDFFQTTVTIHLQLLPSVFTAWQQSVFQPIKDKYDALVTAYQETVAAAAAAYDEASAEYQKAWIELELTLIEADKVRHPFFNTEMARTELKRSVIYLMCQDFSLDGAMIRTAEPCGLPEIDRGRTEALGHDWYFWDRLIDWKLMAYAYFDYFWNPMCDWPERFDPDEPDAMFKAFLRAGYARVLVPVSPGMEQDFLWYVKTHQKWGPSRRPPRNPDDSRWRNVVYELKHANESAMTRREGHIEVTPGSAVAIIKGSDRYWMPADPPAPATGSTDSAAIGLDVDRELFVEGEVYRITSIERSLATGAPDYHPFYPNRMWWKIVLDRPYAQAAGLRFYAIGAKAVAPVFSFDMPTELIWASDRGKCLPTYPLPACSDRRRLPWR